MASSKTDVALDDARVGSAEIAGGVVRVPPGAQAYFSTSFGGTTRIVPAVDGYFHGAREQYRDFTGADPAVGSPNAWEDIPKHPDLGTFRIYYEGGTDAQRLATIETEGGDPAKAFLRFTLAEPNVVMDSPTWKQKKSRVQVELYDNPNLREFYQIARVRLGRAFTVLSEMPEKIGWMNILEMWNQPGWIGLAYPFRMGLSVLKLDAEAGAPFYFKVGSQKQVSETAYEDIWYEANRTFPVPVDEWMTIETYYLEGDAQHGRYYVAVTPADGVRRVLFDIRNCTHHPDNPAPGGMTHYSPIKLYTSAETVEFVKARGHALTVDWDDFSMWKNWRPE